MIVLLLLTSVPAAAFDTEGITGRTESAGMHGSAGGPGALEAVISSDFGKNMSERGSMKGTAGKDSARAEAADAETAGSAGTGNGTGKDSGTAEASDTGAAENAAQNSGSNTVPEQEDDGQNSEDHETEGAQTVNDGDAANGTKDSGEKGRVSSPAGSGASNGDAAEAAADTAFPVASPDGSASRSSSEDAALKVPEEGDSGQTDAEQAASSQADSGSAVQGDSDSGQIESRQKGEELTSIEAPSSGQAEAEQLSSGQEEAEQSSSGQEDAERSASRQGDAERSASGQGTSEQSFSGQTKAGNAASSGDFEAQTSEEQAPAGSTAADAAAQEETWMTVDEFNMAYESVTTGASKAAASTLSNAKIVSKDSEIDYEDLGIGTQVSGHPGHTTPINVKDEDGNERQQDGQADRSRAQVLPRIISAAAGARGFPGRCRRAAFCKVLVPERTGHDAPL